MTDAEQTKAIEQQLRAALADDAPQVDPIRALKDRIDTCLNDYLCEMKPGYDDSIVGFNEAWGVVSKVFAGVHVASPDQLATEADLIKQIMDATYRLTLMVEQSALTLSRIRNLVNALEDARRHRDA